MCRRKIAAVICILAGLLIFAVPLIYRQMGQSRTDELTEQFKQILEEKQNETEKEEGTENSETSLSEEDAAIFAEGDVIAILEIESIGIRYPVVEGCTSVNLNYAIGHMSETAGVGEKGNCVLAGHNGSRHGEFFTKLNTVTDGDVVTLLDTEGVLHSYQITESFVVGSYDNSIKEQSDTKELTLFTCAERGTKRFVVKCKPMEEGETDEET